MRVPGDAIRLRPEIAYPLTRIHVGRGRCTCEILDVESVAAGAWRLATADCLLPMPILKLMVPELEVGSSTAILVKFEPAIRGIRCVAVRSRCGLRLLFAGQ
jgi:hypothetical protein